MLLKDIFIIQLSSNICYSINNFLLFSINRQMILKPRVINISMQATMTKLLNAIPMQLSFVQRIMSCLVTGQLHLQNKRNTQRH